MSDGSELVSTIEHTASRSCFRYCMAHEQDAQVTTGLGLVLTPTPTHDCMLLYQCLWSLYDGREVALGENAAYEPGFADISGEVKLCYGTVGVNVEHIWYSCHLYKVWSLWLDVLQYFLSQLGGGLHRIFQGKVSDTISLVRGTSRLSGGFCDQSAATVWIR